MSPKRDPKMLTQKQQRRREQELARRQKEAARRRAETERLRMKRAKVLEQQHRVALARVKKWLLFLQDAGLAPRIEADYLWLGGSRALKVSGEDVLYKTATGTHRIGATDWGIESALRSLLLAGAGHRLEQRAIESSRDASWLEVKLTERGVRLSADSTELAIVGPMQARFAANAEIRGNFLIDGPHWRKVIEACGLRRRLLEQRELTKHRRTATTPYQRHLPTTTPLRLLTVPAGLTADLAGECLAASRDIRLHRSMALGHRAELRARGCTLVIDPIRRLAGALSVPFTYRENGHEVEGILTIEGEADPLSVGLYQDGLTPTGRNAWVACFFGFRAVSIPEVIVPVGDPEPREPTPRRPALGPKPGLSSRRRATPTPRLTMDQHWSSALLLHRGGRHSAHWVIGHKRILADGQEASAGKVAEAAAYGIRLYPGETWVRPHARGAASDSIMQFQWVAPERFDALIGPTLG